MLLIAQPKSASTSLMLSISEILKVKHKNGQTKKVGEANCEGYEELQKYHGTTVRRNIKYMRRYITDENIIYKEHILPSPEHLSYISKINQNIVVLLREPLETIESYKRVFSVLPELKNIDYKKLLKEIKLFYNTYMELDEDIYLKITFRDVVFDFEDTIKRIIKHYGIDVPKDVHQYALLKRNFTGHGMRKILEEE